MTCDVCNGAGDYPIMNNGGRTLYTIACPECGGSGKSPSEVWAEDEARRERAKYEGAMREMRGPPLVCPCCGVMTSMLADGLCTNCYRESAASVDTRPKDGDGEATAPLASSAVQPQAGDAITTPNSESHK